MTTTWKRVLLYGSYAVMGFIVIVVLLIVIVFALFVWADRAEKRARPGEITCNISAEGSLVCVFSGNRRLERPGSQVRVFSLKDGALLDSLDFPELNVQQAFLARDQWYLEAYHNTPRGRPTQQIFAMPRGAQGKPKLLVADDETRRAGLAIVAGKPIYMRNTQWLGAFGGIPWGGYLDLCAFEDQQERMVQRTDLSLFSILDYQGTYPRYYPYSLSVPPGEGMLASLVWVSVKDGTAKSFLLETPSADLAKEASPLHIGSAAMSPTMTEFALTGSFLDSRTGTSRTDRLFVVDFKSGKTLPSMDINQREDHIGSAMAMYCPKGDLYLAITNPRKREVTISRFADGAVTLLFTVSAGGDPQQPSSGR